MSHLPNDLASVHKQITECTCCDLSQLRTLAVPGAGDPEARLMFVGEGPGFHEDRQGLPFVGAAGRLLDQLLASIGLDRSDVFITNIVKCRPPGNRDPLPQEIEACHPYLARQIELIDPEIIVPLGRLATAQFLGPGLSISRIHGQVYRREGRLVIPLLHPAAALRQERYRQDLEQDFAVLKRTLDQGVEPSAAGTEHREPPEQLSLL